MSESAPITSLELSGATTLQRVARLQGLSEAALRRFAVTAANERDEEALWELMQAHLTLRGLSGVTTSAHTLRAYRRGLHELLVMWRARTCCVPHATPGRYTYSACVRATAPRSCRRSRPVRAADAPSKRDPSRTPP